MSKKLWCLFRRRDAVGTKICVAKAEKAAFLSAPTQTKSRLLTIVKTMRSILVLRARKRASNKRLATVPGLRRSAGDPFFPIFPISAVPFSRP